jgi:ribonuclease BN (tRNA processing enzyme)
MIARVDAAGEWAPPFSLTVDEVRFGSKVGEVAVCSAAHRVPTLALRADISGKSVCYSSDTRHSTNVVELAKNVDVLIHEASYLQHQAFIALISGHSTARAAGKVAALAGARKLVLTHIPPRNDGKTSEYLEEAGMEYSGEIIVAEDMVTVDV